MTADLKSIVSDRNWYQIQLKQFPKLSMAGLRPAEGKDAAAVIFQTTNTSSPAQKWQISASLNSSYVLRSQVSEGNAYLSVRENNTAQEELGGLTAITRDAQKVGPEALWTIQPFGDGFFHLENLANGTDWRLFGQEKGLVAMTQNISSQQPNQSFSMTRLGTIQDEHFQSPPVEPGPTASPPTDTPPIPTIGTDLPSNPGGGSNGLSTGATIGVAVSVSVLAVIALGFGIFVYLRRYRQKNDIRTSLVTETIEAPYLRSQDPPKHGYHQFSPEPSQSQDVEPHELDTSHGISEISETATVQQRSPVELPSSLGEGR